MKYELRMEWEAPPSVESDLEAELAWKAADQVLWEKLPGGNVTCVTGLEDNGQAFTWLPMRMGE